MGVKNLDFVHCEEHICQTMEKTREILYFFQNS